MIYIVKVITKTPSCKAVCDTIPCASKETAKKVAINSLMKVYDSFCNTVGEEKEAQRKKVCEHYKRQLDHLNTACFEYWTGYKYCSSIYEYCSVTIVSKEIVILNNADNVKVEMVESFFNSN